MIKKIQTVILSFLSLGLTKDTPWLLASRVQITNAITLFGYLLILLNTISNIFQKDSIGLLLDLIWFIAASIIPISNYYNKHYLVFLVMVFMFSLMTDVSWILLGGNAIMIPMYLVSIVMAIFFFERKIEQILGVVFILLNYMIAFIIIQMTDLPTPKPAAIDLHFYFLFSVFSISTITIRVLNENKKRLKETERLLKIVNNKNEALQQFAYITSHDLKEPLRNIGSFSGLLERRLKNNTDPITQEYLSFIKNNAIQLNGLIESIWDFVEISNTEASSFETVDVHQALIMAQEQLTHLIKSTKTSIKYPKTLPKVKGKRPLLILLFQHLIENGIKFNTSPVPIIEISVQKNEEVYIFSIKDNGIGIAPDYFELIFQPYKTLQNKSIHKGSGVGLAICKRIIEQHRGKIWLKSKKTEGTTFYFSLPILADSTIQ